MGPELFATDSRNPQGLRRIPVGTNIAEKLARKFISTR